MRSRSAMGITGPKLCTEKITSAFGLHGANGDGGAVDRVLACVVDVLRKQHGHQAAIAAEDQRLSSGRSIATFIEASRSLRPATTSSIGAATPTGNACTVTSSGIEPRGGQQARGQVVQQVGLLIDERRPVRLAGESLPISERPVDGGANRSQGRLVRREQGGRARWSEAARSALGFDAAFVGEGAIAVEGDGNQRGNGIVGQRTGVSAQHEAADGHGAKANDTAADPGSGSSSEFRSNTRSAPVPADRRPEAGLVDLVQIGIEEGHRFQRKDLVDQFDKLRAGLHMQIHLQRAPRELVEVVHLAAPGIRLARVLSDARGKAATTSAVKTNAPA